MSAAARLVTALLPPPHFLTVSPSGHHSTHRPLSSHNATGARWHRGSAAHTAETKSAAPQILPDYSPTLPKTLTTTIGVSYENYSTVVTLKISEIVNIIHVEKEVNSEARMSSKPPQPQEKAELSSWRDLFQLYHEAHVSTSASGSWHTEYPAWALVNVTSWLQVLSLW